MRTVKVKLKFKQLKSVCPYRDHCLEYDMCYYCTRLRQHIADCNKKNCPIWNEESRERTTVDR